MKPPDLNKDTPRLSQLPRNIFMDRLGQLVCAKCGGVHDLQRWQEHNHFDQPEAKIVVLCAWCSKEIIEPHPRLYRQLMRQEFVPGSSQVCVDCKWQDHLGCNSPVAKFNGGPGMEYTPSPQRCHFYFGGRRGGMWTAIEAVTIKECTGKEQKPWP